jgi:hypothetical protein
MTGWRVSNTHTIDALPHVHVHIPGNNINTNISLPQFHLSVELGHEYATDYYDLSYPGVIMRVILSRKMSFHIIQTYIPSAMFVALAWLTIFIPPEQVPGNDRVTGDNADLGTVTFFRSRDHDHDDTLNSDSNVRVSERQRPQGFLRLHA